MLSLGRAARDVTIVLASVLSLPWLVFGGIGLYAVAQRPGDLVSAPVNLTLIVIAGLLACVVGPFCLWAAFRDRRRGLTVRPLMFGLSALATALPLGAFLMIGAG